MSRVTLTPRARADLDDIWLHVAMDAPAAADRLMDRIVTHVSSSPITRGSGHLGLKSRRKPGY